MARKHRMTFKDKMDAIDRFFDSITSDEFNDLLEKKYGIPKTSAEPQKTYIGIVEGGSTTMVGNSTIGTIEKIIDQPSTLDKVVPEVFKYIEDIIVNSDDSESVRVIAYGLLMENVKHFTVTDKNPHQSDLDTLKQQLLDGHIGVVRVKPSGCSETQFTIMEV